MNVTAVTFVAFATIVLFAGMVATLIRVVWLGPQRALGQRLGHDEDLVQIPVALTESVAGPSRGIRGRIDNGFNRLVSESGTSVSAESALLLVVACGLLIGGILFLGLDNPLVGGLGAVLGVVLFVGYLVVKRVRRRRKMRDQLPDAIDMLARAVHAGETIEQALSMVGKHADPPLSVEFRRSASHMGFGLSTDATMRAFCRRVPITEADILAATLIVQRRAGGNLPRVLESLSYVIRDRLNYQRQFRAATAGARMSAGVMLIAVPVIVGYLFTWQRDYFGSLLFTDLGRGILFAAFLLQAAGVLWIYFLLKPDY